jgi:hypothetical protein
MLTGAEDRTLQSRFKDCFTNAGCVFPQRQQNMILPDTMLGGFKGLVGCLANARITGAAQRRW